MREEIEEMIAKNRVKIYLEAARSTVKLGDLLSVMAEEKRQSSPSDFFFLHLMNEITRMCSLSKINVCHT